MNSDYPTEKRILGGLSGWVDRADWVRGRFERASRAGALTG